MIMTKLLLLLPFFQHAVASHELHQRHLLDHEESYPSSLRATQLRQRYYPEPPKHRYHNYKESFLKQEMLARRRVDLDANHCGTEEPTLQDAEVMNTAVAAWKAMPLNKRRRLAATKYVIPVYLHVLNKNQTASGLRATSQRQFIATLNHGFRESPFTFTLASVSHTVNAEWSKCKDEEGFKRALRVNGTDVLNVYVCNTHAKSGGQVGFSYFPPIVWSPWATLDGVVIMNPDLDVFEDSVVYNGLTHEVGHWLGLTHTFEGGCSNETFQLWQGQESYTFSGDGVSDTAAHDGPTFRHKEGFDSCWQDTQLNTCHDGSGCDPGVDPVDNYMNVIPGPCYEKFGRFTPGQVERMLIQYETFRFRGVYYEDPTTSRGNGENKTTDTCKRRQQSCATDEDCCGTLRCYRRGKCGR